MISAPRAMRVVLCFFMFVGSISVVPVLAAVEASGPGSAHAAAIGPPDSLAAPRGLQPIEDLSLESLLGREIRGGEMGSYGLRLSEYDSRAELHGYLSTEFKGATRGTRATYDLHHAVLVARADFFGRIVPEFGIEFEHAGTEYYVPYAQVDLKSSDAFIFRVGYFVAPVGAFNEFQYPDFLRKTVLAPLAMSEVVPALWSEVGVQVRGKAVNADGRGVNYAVFSSNGLEQPDPDPRDAVAPEGGSLRSMRRHAQDRTNSDKAFGGRLGGSVAEGLDLGISGYHGAYTSDGMRDLTILDSDLTYHRGALTVRFEAAIARQDVTGGRLDKRGGYVLCAARVRPAFEPYLQLESVHLEGMPDPLRRRLIAGMVHYPFPDQAPNALLKLEAAWTRYGDDVPTGQLLAQLTIGF